MTREEVRETLFAYLTEHCLAGDATELSEQTKLVELGLIDSVGMVKLVSHLEKTFGFEVADEEMNPEDLGTPAGIIELVLRKVP